MTGAFVLAHVAIKPLNVDVVDVGKMSLQIIFMCFLFFLEGRHLSLHDSTTSESETSSTTAKLTAEGEYSTCR